MKGQEESAKIKVSLSWALQISLLIIIAEIVGAVDITGECFKSPLHLNVSSHPWAIWFSQSS